MNLRTGESEYWGTFYQVLTVGPFAGSGFAGTWTTNSIIGHGFGALDGWMDYAHFVNGFGGAVGYVMSPADK